MNKLITRRHAVKSLCFGTAGLISSTSMMCHRHEQHIITLSFDDGLEKSTIKTAEIFEKHGLSACINVIATGHVYSLEESEQLPMGDFELWNELKARGHEIMPHSYQHSNLAELPIEEAKGLILKCLDVFNEKLDGFNAKEAIYNFAYNSSTPEIEAWLTGQVRAFRTSGQVINPLPFEGMKKLTCISYGPGNIDAHLEKEINSFLEGPPGWFIYNTHGIDGEGWGPVSSGYLDELLDRLTQMKNVKVLPVADVLDLV